MITAAQHRRSCAVLEDLHGAALRGRQSFGGGQSAVDRQHAGRPSPARELIDLLVGAGTFTELASAGINPRRAA